MPGFFDHNATSPLLPTAREAWLEAAERFWHNPSSLYREAAAAKRRLEECRERIAELIGCEPHLIVFNSGATEGNNTVIHAATAIASSTSSAAPSTLIVHSSLEHPSLRAPAARHRAHILPCSPSGITPVDSVRELLAKTRPALVSVMAANNETGALQPWLEIREACLNAGVPFHCDAVQWLGRLPCGESGKEIGQCDWLTASAHKFGGPRGAGFLKVPAITPGINHALLSGGPQESSWRGGTENLPGICAMTAALESAASFTESPAEVTSRTAWRDAFEQELESAFSNTSSDGTSSDGNTSPSGSPLTIVAQEAPRLWNTVSLIMPRHDQRKWLARLDARGFQVSTGSACSIGTGAASQVLTAMGYGINGELNRVLRISSAWSATREDWSALAAALTDTLLELDAESASRPSSRGVPSPLQPASPKRGTL